MKKIKPIKLLSTLFILLYPLLSFAQESGFSIPDSLKNATYRELITKFNSNTSNKELYKLYAKVYLQKGKEDTVKIHIARGYRLLSIVETDYEKGLKYLDSGIAISKDLKHYRYPAILYTNKGVELNEKGKYKEALTNYLESIRHSKKNNNENFAYITLHNVGLLKRRLGEYEEAIKILKECMEFDDAKKEKKYIDSLSYAMTAVELAKTYTLKGQIDSSEYYTEKVMPFLSKKKEGVFYLSKFNKALNEYHKRNYGLSIDILNECIRFTKNGNLILYTNEEFLPEAYYYLAENYHKINDKENMIQYAKKIDSCFEANKLPSTEVKRAYELLIENYKEEKNTEKQLLYIEKLLIVDSLLQGDYKMLNASMNKKFDVPNLLKEKEEIISKLREYRKKSFNGLLTLSLLLLFSGIVIWFYYRRQQLHKKRFQKLINTDKPIKIENKKPENKSMNIDEKILKKILNSLQRFEENKDYIARKITLASLAKDFETNPRYISQVVNEYKNKNFSNYLSDLRINHAIARLKIDETFRKYTIKAIAYDVGFSNSQSFSNAFHKETGIYPSYFIKKINESKN
ncbi:helix-turn-helix domain-containing protein [Kordia sp. YSTF-M3]|uniref:Helix-turn-helix domain-containing protein n=1 Tax=Kordia aestuariivivens TaxID=2759037 RepID=A0ABR7Q9K1_9FLAO|nr:helix-turn-helix domain-containing protein [Kordia aestuariivivens]MBC8755251.1 helix-turn-helix domain-containing protein [Kordia aestuariivivens]